MRDYLFFDTMLTPRIITLVYWLKLVAVLLTGFVIMLNGGASVIAGLIFIPIGFLMVRVMCELLILIFKINENIKKIADSPRSGNS
jgi:hypothetical protein